MTHLERFDTALTLVRAGKTIRFVVQKIYKTWRRYKKECSDAQRKQLSSIRLEVRRLKRIEGKVQRKLYTRFIFNTTPELHKDVHDYCQDKEIDVSRFLNSSIREALRKAKA